MYYTVYKITNQINGKIYIGMHQTKDLEDGYMGSGTYLKRAKQKYGIENFTKEILFIFDTYEDMAEKERELVNEEFVSEDTNYNQVVGGGNGYYWINKFGLNTYEGKAAKDRAKLIELATPKRIELLNTDEDFRRNYSKSVSTGVKRYYENNESHWSGRKHSDETKRKISLANKKSQAGKKNSQFGTMWITNGTESKKVDMTSPIPNGWVKGRKMKKNF